MTVQDPTILTLRNGIRVVYLFDDAMVSHLGVTVLGGSRYEQQGEEGLAHFLEHCIFKGTTKRRAFHVLSRLDSVGGELNAYTTKEEIAVYASFTNEHLNRASDLLADIVFNSTFPEKEIEKEKEVILDEINAYLDSPSDKIFDDFEAYMFPEHSLGSNILGTRDSVKSFTREKLISYVERFFQPENMVISFVGNCSQKKLLNRLEKDFGNVSSTKKVDLELGKVVYQPFFKRFQESNYQTHIMIGGMAPGYNDRNRRVMTLLVNMLGGPALNSRLALSVREKYGFSYNVEANFTPYQELGYWAVYASTDKAHEEKTVKLILKEIDRFRREILTENQLKKAKEQLKGHLALGMDSNSGMMLSFGKGLLIFNEIDTLVEIHESIDSITAEEVKEMAHLFFDTQNVATLIFEPCS
jgi:predicted Zn-dependent peptidase